LRVVLVLIICAVVFNGMLGGASLEATLVKLPARKRIGARAYAVFARGNDLGNGLWVYQESVLAQKLDTFARWHAVRAAFQVLTFLVLIWSLVVAR
jgi:hypothetical protein